VTTLSFSDIYKQVETGASGIPAGTYDVTVEDVRVKADTRILFLDLRVLDGPAAGKSTQVNLSVPNAESKQGAFFHFRRKIAGFQGEDLKIAFSTADRAPTEEAALSVIADALRGKTVTANLNLVKEGTYKGTNELLETRIQSQTPTQAAAEFQPAAAVPAESDGAKAVPF